MLKLAWLWQVVWLTNFNLILTKPALKWNVQEV